MESRPLGYESLKIMLEHMDANLRIQLFKCIPSLRNVERVVPLKIDKLRFDPDQIEINGIVYKLGIYKEYPYSEAVSDLVARDNNFGGVSQDIDHLGFEDFSTEGILLPGDFIIHAPGIKPVYKVHRDINEEQKRNLNQYIEKEERRLEQVQRKGDQDHWLNKYVPYQLEPYYHLRNGTVPKYERQIQFTMMSNRMRFTIGVERLKYNQKLYVAQKYLSNFLFEGRKATMRVKKLNIPMSDYVLIRIPNGLKMKIRKLNIGGNAALENKKLMSIIDNSSYPLENIYISSIKGSLNLPVIATAQKLEIGEVNKHQNPLQVVLNLTNKKFECCQPFNAQELFLVIWNWLKSSREIGTEYVFNGVSNKKADALLKIVSERINGTIVGERSIAIPMNNEAHLKVSFAPDIRFQQISIKVEVVRTI